MSSLPSIKHVVDALRSPSSDFARCGVTFSSRRDDVLSNQVRWLYAAFRENSLDKDARIYCVRGDTYRRLEISSAKGLLDVAAPAFLPSVLVAGTRGDYAPLTTAHSVAERFTAAFAHESTLNEIRRCEPPLTLPMFIAGAIASFGATIITRQPFIGLAAGLCAMQAIDKLYAPIARERAAATIAARSMSDERLAHAASYTGAAADAAANARAARWLPSMTEWCAASAHNQYRKIMEQRAAATEFTNKH